MQTAIPCLFMRGGTSRGPFFLESDLPSDPALRDRVLLAAMGSPDSRQIDGLGGADPLTSKVGARVALGAAWRRPRVPVRAGADRRGPRGHDAELRQHAGRRRAVRARPRARRGARRRDHRAHPDPQHGNALRRHPADARRARHLRGQRPHRRRARHVGADPHQLPRNRGLGVRLAAADRPRRRHVRRRAGDLHRQRHARRRDPRGGSRPHRLRDARRAQCRCGAQGAHRIHPAAGRSGDEPRRRDEEGRAEDVADRAAARRRQLSARGRSFRTIATRRSACWAR